MIFVDTNVFMYAVGRQHPLRDEARSFFAAAAREHLPLQTSAEVLQELLHAYLPVGRLVALDGAMELIERSVLEIWPLEPDDARVARQLHDQIPELSARDLCYLACCRRRNVAQVKTFDRGLEVAAARFL